MCTCVFPDGSVVKTPPANAGEAGDVGSIPGSSRCLGGGDGNPLQYSCLENPIDRGAWWATVHGVAKSWTRLSDWACTHYRNTDLDFGFSLATFLSHFYKSQWGTCQLAFFSLFTLSTLIFPKDGPNFILKPEVQWIVRISGGIFLVENSTSHVQY